MSDTQPSHESLLERIAVLEAENAELRRRNEQQQERRLRTFEILVENAPDGITMARLDRGFTYGNRAFRAMVGYGDELVELPLSAILIDSEEERRAIRDELTARGFWQGNMTYRRKNGSSFIGQTTVFLIREEGQPTSTVAMIRDVTEQLRAEEERRRLQEQVIEGQRAVLRELSTPLVPIADGVVAIPLVGAIDSARAQQIMETLLVGVAERQAEIAILDITGVQVVDTQIANAFVRAALAVQLLGAQVVLTGIGPEIAQTLVQLGSDLRGLQTRGTFQDGIAYALNRRK